MINRRTFGRISIGSTLATLHPAKSLVAADPPSNRVRVGFIGTGNQGMGLLKRFLRLPHVQVAAVCDVNQGSFGYKQDSHFYGREPAACWVDDVYQSARRHYEKCSQYSRFEAMLDRRDLDAVFVVVPDHSHARISIAALESGKDVYCEKPLSFSVGDGAKMVAAVRKNNRILQTGSHERSNPISQFVCEAVKAGRVGQLKRVVTKVGFNNKYGPGPGWSSMPVPASFDYEEWLGTAPRVPYHQDRCLYRFRFNYDYSGGQITNYGAHCNDMAHWGMGLDLGGPKTIECLAAKFLPSGSLFNTATETKFRATYASGVELICESGPENVQTRFEGSDGWMQTGYRGTSASDPDLLDGLETTQEPRKYDAYQSHMANFIDCVKNRAEPRAPVETGHCSATLCHLANIAIRRFPQVGREVLHWDHAAQRFLEHDEANRWLG